jgi:aspartyl-tRNA(Asn)/glutamyl-tRNA(Gln) amidotransferase subunit A
MTADDTAFASLTEIAQRIKSGAVSAAEVTEATLARINACDGVLNSYITVMADSAREAARRADGELRGGRAAGPLHGVPIALKDLLATKGVRTTFACAAFADFIPEENATVVERLTAAGAIIIGKLNLHEAAAGSSSLVSHFGPVRNPWNPGFIAGGSSGGSAACVAAGLAYGALGSDTAMSIRHPAALCGIVGLKPTYGRVSKHGALPLSWSLDHIGPMTRTVADAALMLQVMAGHDAADPSSRDVPVADYLAKLGDGVQGLRIGVPRRFFFDECSAPTLAAVEAAIDTLRRLGARIEDCELPHADDAAMAARTILLAEAAAYHAERFRTTAELLTAGLRTLIELGCVLTAVQLVQAQRLRQAITQHYVATISGFDR